MQRRFYILNCLISIKIIMKYVPFHNDVLISLSKWNYFPRCPNKHNSILNSCSFWAAWEKCLKMISVLTLQTQYRVIVKIYLLNLSSKVFIVSMMACPAKFNRLGVRTLENKLHNLDFLPYPPIESTFKEYACHYLFNSITKHTFWKTIKTPPKSQYISNC